MILARLTRNSLLAAFGVALSGCMHVPVTTLYKLWSFDMATADPAILRVATRVPSYFSARPNGALPAGKILTSTYLLVNPAVGYLPVLEDIDLRQEISQTDLAEKLPACPAA
jgi:hypothetical protein